MNFISALPEKHQQVMSDPSDPIHRACDFYVPPPDANSRDILALNRELRSIDAGRYWPDFLIAFASNGCGDYFAYDTRQSPPSIIYIDPSYTPQEKSNDPEALRYNTFDDWYESKLEWVTCSYCGSRDIRFEASLDRQWLLRICPGCGAQEPSAPIGDTLS